MNKEQLIQDCLNCLAEYENYIGHISTEENKRYSGPCLILTKFLDRPTCDSRSISLAASGTDIIVSGAIPLFQGLKRQGNLGIFPIKMAFKLLMIKEMQ
jgi:hypothetical protein